MPFRHEPRTHRTATVAPSKHAFCRQSPLHAWIVFAAIASCSIAAAFAQETSKPQAQAGAPTADQPPNSPSKVPGVALYNLLQAKSIVFPDIAASTARLSSGQKFQLFVDNSISVHTITWSVLGSAGEM